MPSDSTQHERLEQPGPEAWLTRPLPILAADAILCDDGSSMLAAAVKEIGVAHQPTHVSAEQRVIAGVCHIQNVSAYDSRLKGSNRRFHGVATRHLANYLGWFRALDRWSGSSRNPRRYWRRPSAFDGINT